MLGIGNAERLGVDAVGARNKRFMRINTGGSTGHLVGGGRRHDHIAAGACDVVLTAGADKVGECGDSQTILNKIWDPTYERPLPLGTITMLAMSAVRYMHKYGMTEEDMARVTVKNRGHAALNPKAHLRKKVTIDDVMRLALHLLADQAARLLPAIERRLRDGAGVASATSRRTSSTPSGSPASAHCSETYYHRRPDGQQARRPTTPTRTRCGESFERAYRMAGHHRIRRSRCTSPSSTRRSATPSSTPSRRRASRAWASRMAMLREGAFDIGGDDPGQPVGRHAVHQRDRRDRDGARGGGGAAGLGPRRRPPGQGRARRHRQRQRRRPSVLRHRWSSKPRQRRTSRWNC